MQCYVLERIMLNGWVEYLVFHEKEKAVEHAEALMQSHDVDACQIHASHIMDRRDCDGKRNKANDETAIENAS